MSLKPKDISVGLLDQLIRHCPEMFTYMQSSFRSLMLTLQRITYLYMTVTIIQNISQINIKIKQKRSIHCVYLQNTLYTSSRRLSYRKRCHQDVSIIDLLRITLLSP
jgi:hypothetical protein